MSDQIIVATFNTTNAAYDAVTAMKALKDQGLTDFKPKAGVMVKKDDRGNLSLLETKDRPLWGTAVGTVTGALIGLIGYVLIFASLFAPETETSRFAAVVFTVVGFGFSAYLTNREIFSIHHICEWCLSSFVIITAIMCLATWRFLHGDHSRPPEGEGDDVAASDTGAPLASARS